MMGLRQAWPGSVPGRCAAGLRICPPQDPQLQRLVVQQRRPQRLRGHGWREDVRGQGRVQGIGHGVQQRGGAAGDADVGVGGLGNLRALRACSLGCATAAPAHAAQRQAPPPTSRCRSSGAHDLRTRCLPPSTHSAQRGSLTDCAVPASSSRPRATRATSSALRLDPTCSAASARSLACGGRSGQCGAREAALYKAARIGSGPAG